MKKKILYLLGGILMFLSVFGIIGGSYVNAAGEDDDQGKNGEMKNEECDGIKLNTDFPLIGNCIKTGIGGQDDINPTNAFPTMVAALTKITMSVILVVCLILIIVGGIMIASDNKIGQGKNLIKKVAIVILLLGFSSLILKLINPNFF